MKPFLLLLILLTGIDLLPSEQQEINLVDTYWVSSLGTTHPEQLYFTEDFYISSNTLVARQVRYQVRADSICLAYNPRYNANRFLRIMEMNADSMVIQGWNTDLTTTWMRSTEAAFLASLKDQPREGLQRVLRGSKYYEQIDAILGEE